MQPLTAAPREAFTPTQITALLTATDMTVDFGCELLSPSLVLIEDISSDVSGGKVSRDNLADIHGTVDLSISRALAWGRDRVRPYQMLSSRTAGVSGARFNLGVFVMVTPDSQIGETPPTYAVTGYDQLHLLQGSIGDSYSVGPGAVEVLTAVRNALTAAGITAPVLLDTSAAGKTLATAMTWPQTSSDNPTWIQVVNDLLACIGYRGIWADWNGALRSGPYVLPSSRASEFTLNVGDLRTGVVAEQRNVAADLWNVPNWARFIRNDNPGGPPVEGLGRYTVTNPSTGPSSIASVGRTVRAPVVYLDAVDQASLMVQGDRLFAAARRTSEVITVKTSPLPCWHSDRMTYADAALGDTRQVLARSWSLPLDGGDADLILESV